VVSRSSIAAFWDAAAGSFDDEADHGLADPAIRSAWADALASWLPDRPVDVADLGCGTGSLSLLMARSGHRVVGVDLSPNMAARARDKLAGLDAWVVVGDAAVPPLAERSVDVVLVRHLVWTLPDPVTALRRWISLCRQGGRVVLVEGRWAPGGDDYVHDHGELPWTGGVTAKTLAATLLPHVRDLRVVPLTDPRLWGRAITDERYAVIAIP
jgi:ubiquinone/menaquinone biosynthesis C-methylase UbiE